MAKKSSPDGMPLRKPSKPLLSYSTRIYIPDAFFPSIYIGIDTGVKTGYAFWNPEYKYLKVQTSSIHKAMADVGDILKTGTPLMVRVEDARQRKWFGRNASDKQQGAGSVKRDSNAWNRFLVDMAKTYPGMLGFEMVAPKNNKTKLDPVQFAKLTGYTRRTSEHGRDAAMLVYGYSPNKQLIV